MKNNIKYLIVGFIFGIVFIKGEIISWFRIQEMFRFHSFHMYGVIGTAVVVGFISILLIKKFNLHALGEEKIDIPNKEFGWGQVFGGLIFGMGWALTGACPGPLYAQIGAGYSIIIVTLVFAILGTWIYGLLSNKLPD